MQDDTGCYLRCVRARVTLDSAEGYLLMGVALQKSEALLRGTSLIQRLIARNMILEKARVKYAAVFV
jgi:hypothetical protein